MRQIIYAIIILYSILIISGCNGNKTTNKLMPELEQAEKVMFECIASIGKYGDSFVTN